MSWAKGEVRQRGDWFLYLLLVGAALCLPLGITASGWVPNGQRLIYTVLWASIAGILLARSPLPDGLAWLLGIALGLEYSLQFAGGLLPSLGLFVEDVGHAVGWLWQLLFQRTLNPELPFSSSAAYVASQGQAMVGNLTAWLAAVQSSTPSRDNTALYLGASFITWILTWNAGFELFRRRRTFAALIPLGVVVVTNVSFTDIGMAYVHVFLAATLLTLVWANVGRMEAVWSRLGLDFSPELRRDAAVAGFSISTLVMVAALLIPYTTYNDAVWFFWDHYGPRFQAFYKKLDYAFAGRNPAPKPTPSKRGVTPHEIRGGPDLTEETVLLVQTSDAPPPPEEEIVRMGQDPAMFVTKHYWRERTYDVYTGHGWDSSERKSNLLRPNSSWSEPGYPHTVLTQTFELMTPHDLAYAVNEPVKVYQEYRVFTRGPEDFSGFSVGGITYTVVSWIPDVTTEELRQAEEEYPSWVQQRFLTLPVIPERVRQKAEEVVRQAGATTRFDKARAIETYLRTLEYDAKLEPPALDVDVVDYFLFTAKRGYCDYSATAMVIMLRSVGVAARYASGYGMGRYSYDRDAYLVSESNGHAWAEVYFPSYGWIEFEPTPIQRVFSYLGSHSPSLGALQPVQSVKSASPVPPLWLASAGLLLVLLFVIIWPPRWFRRTRTPQEAIWRIYGKVVGRARWLGLSPMAGETPREYMIHLTYEIERRAGLGGGAGRDIELIARTYERARYSTGPIGEDESYRVEGAWRRLRGMLLRLVFFRVPRSAVQTPTQGAEA